MSVNYTFMEKCDSFSKYSHIKSLLMFGEDSDIKPRVTIAIQTYKRLELLKEAVQSVLDQKDFEDFEILIIDNDDQKLYSNQIIEYLSKLDNVVIRYYINQTSLPSWNRCIELARGEWMTILCDDDILFPTYLKTLCYYIDKNQGVNKVECRYQRFVTQETITQPKRRLVERIESSRFGKTRKLDYFSYFYSCYTAPHSQLYKRDLAYSLGGFNERFRPVSDYVFNLAYSYNFGPSLFIDEYLCGYRTLVNDSLRPITIIGCMKWGKRIRESLLEIKSNSLLRLFNKLQFDVDFLEYKKNKPFYRYLLRKMCSVAINLITIITKAHC